MKRHFPPNDGEGYEALAEKPMAIPGEVRFSSSGSAVFDQARAAPDSAASIDPNDGLPVGFALDAYSGGELSLGADVPVYADLEEMEIPKQTLPVFEDHNSFAPLGFSDSVEKIAGRGLVVSGRWLRPSRDTAPGDFSRVLRVRDYMAQGYPWEVSIGAKVRSAREYSRGEEFEVNGRKGVGPALVLSTRLREVSIVGLGADSETYAIAARKGQSPGVTMSDPVTQPATPARDPAASIAELRAEFGDDLGYCLEAAEQGLTLLQAQAGYARVLKQKLSQALATPANQRIEVVQASAPVVIKGGAPTNTVDPIVAFGELLEANLAKGMKRPEAVAAIAKNHKTTHKAYLQAMNADLPAGTFIPSSYR